MIGIFVIRNRIESFGDRVGVLDGSYGFEGIEVVDEDWHGERSVLAQEGGEFLEEGWIFKYLLKVFAGKHLMTALLERVGVDRTCGGVVWFNEIVRGRIVLDYGLEGAHDGSRAFGLQGGKGMG